MLNGADKALVLGWFATAAGAVWLYAGLVKLRRPLTRADVAAIAQSLAGLHPVLRWAVPAIEVAVGLALVSGIHARAAGFTGTLLGAAFALLHIAAMVRAGLSDVPLPGACGCFGRSSGNTLSTSHAAPNTAVRGALDFAAVRDRGWDLAKAGALAIVTWAATLPCPCVG